MGLTPVATGIRRYFPFNKSTPVIIRMETTNFSTSGASVVAVRIASKYGGATTVNATYQSGSNPAIWNASATLPVGFVTLQVRATAP